MQIGNALNWFEIPVADFARAKKFYETIFDYQMPENTMGKAKMGFFYTIFRVEKSVVPSFITPTYIRLLQMAHWFISTASPIFNLYLIKWKPPAVKF